MDRYAILAKDEKEAIEICQIFHMLGYKWTAGGSLETAIYDHGYINAYEPLPNHRVQHVLYPGEDLKIISLDNFKALYPELFNKEKPDRWRATPGEAYYFITTTGYVAKAFEKENDRVSAHRWYAHNYFETEEKAEEARKQIKKLLKDF